MSGISNYILNQKINAILGKTSGLPSVINLDTTLTTGNNAGSNDIDMNNQDILNVDNIDLTTINGSAYPPVVASPDLDAVLTTGNNAGSNDIDMNNQDILNVDNIDLTTINGSAYPPVATPSGAIMSYAGNVAPSGWLICDGSSVATATYPDLFAVIGYDFGGGGANFNLPDLSQRVPVGVGGSFARTNTGGSTTHTLTISQMPSHNHGVIDPGHNHNYGVLGVGQVGGGVVIPTNSFTFTQITTTKTTNISIANAGGGSAFNILQPYLVLYYIIKT